MYKIILKHMHYIDKLVIDYCNKLDSLIEFVSIDCRPGLSFLLGTKFELNNSACKGTNLNIEDSSRNCRFSDGASKSKDKLVN